MKSLRYLKALAWLLVSLAVATSCSSSRGLGRRGGGGGGERVRQTSRISKSQRIAQEKEAQEQSAVQVVTTDTLQKEEFLGQMAKNVQTVRFITSKIKFSVESGNQQMTLTGNLKMKRDDVIRLQLMAFGFVEAGRLEFTPEYVMIIDRINKQYLKLPYNQLDFMRVNNIDFNVIQSLFWNEVYKSSAGGLGRGSALDVTEGVDNDIVLSANTGDRLSYRWLAERGTARVKMANILYTDRYRGNSQLNWDYEDFKKGDDQKFFPRKHSVTVTTPDKEVKFNMVLNYIGNDENWDTRTKLSSKYRQVDVDEILRRFMAL